jgi:hypothetical protein
MQHYVLGIRQHGLDRHWGDRRLGLLRTNSWPSRLCNFQVGTTKAEAKINRTLAACDRYDTDPVLDRVSNRISKGFHDEDLANNPKDYNLDMLTLFNYLESIAIGVSKGLYDKGLYDKKIVTDQLGPIIIGYVDDLILSGVTGWDNPAEDFDHLMKLYHEWKAKA